jgi:endonuclease YncB( thermonuclease family)
MGCFTVTTIHADNNEGTCDCRLLASVADGHQTGAGQIFTAQVTKVTDGETFDARRSDGQSMTNRRFGVDAPESNQPYGRKALRAMDR